ncbi:MAG: hypothetical protein KC421_19360 [Anaerolineales bacterium]|nr:hypothetical protein [Anaerolineales bacterium]
MLTQEIITVQMTAEQYQIFVNALETAKARDMAIAEWTGETAAQIEARYQVPADDILDDMADAFFAQRTGVPMF